MNGIQWVSLAGACMILAAFALLQAGRWKGTDQPYLWLNLAGSILLTVVALMEAQWGFVLLEVAWAGVSAWGLLRHRGALA